MYSMNDYDSLAVKIRMMSHVIRDEETDEIMGINPDVPDDEMEAYKKMIAEMESSESVLR